MIAIVAGQADRNCEIALRGVIPVQAPMFEMRMSMLKNSATDQLHYG